MNQLRAIQDLQNYAATRAHERVTQLRYVQLTHERRHRPRPLWLRIAMLRVGDWTVLFVLLGACAWAWWLV